MALNYHEELKKKYTLKLRTRMEELPIFLEEFFRGIADTTAPRTRLGYAYDLKIFFLFLTTERPLFTHLAITEFTLTDLARVTPEDLEIFMEYLSFYIRKEKGLDIEFQNDERGKSRKLSALRTMFLYFYKRRKLAANPSEIIDFPKIHDKAITRLEIDEVARLLDEVESGDKLTQRQKKYHVFTKNRDLAIITLLLGTGMRVSECVGIDISHIDFEINGIKITRKGGNEVILFFGDEVAEALEMYLAQRMEIAAMEGHEDAMFLSLQKRRLTDRSIQMLVKKYAALITSLKKISPHKLRSTFGTNLYRETGDIYLVADVLGHTDVNTTRKHYAEIDEDRRRQAVKYIKLRRD